MEDVRTKILEKQREMQLLQQQMQVLNQQRLEDLYPGRCFQYCIDHDLGTQEELAILGEVDVRDMAERTHFSETARQTRWPCGNDECEGWDCVADTCPCGTTQFYWVYEEKLSLATSAIPQPPAASKVEK